MRLEVSGLEADGRIAGGMGFVKSVSRKGVHEMEKLLCRCGRSLSKPFCDESHLRVDYDDSKSDQRVADKVDEFKGKELAILDNRGVCSHAGFCTDMLASVWKAGTIRSSKK